jgi:hypothetical protein
MTFFKSQNNLNVLPEHLEDLYKSGLSDEIIQMAGIRSLTADEVRGMRRHGLVSAYEIPYDLKISGGFSRFKCFYKQGYKGSKYIQGVGTGNHLFMPKLVLPFISSVYMPLFITEGEKKTLKAIQEGLICVGLSGLWNWSDGNKNLIADFDLINFKNRIVYIVPDNDFKKPNKHGYKKNLVNAVSSLAELLKKRKANVMIVNLDEDDDAKGLDDFLIKYGVGRFLFMLNFNDYLKGG